MQALSTCLSINETKKGKKKVISTYPVPMFPEEDGKEPSIRGQFELEVPPLVVQEIHLHHFEFPEVERGVPGAHPAGDPLFFERKFSPCCCWEK